MCSSRLIIFLGFLSLLIIPSPAATGPRYVQVGSDIEFCDVKCPHTRGFLTLECRDGRPLLDINCHHNRTFTNDIDYKDRLYMNTSSGCEVLRDARKKDSCVYQWRFHDGDIKEIKILVQIVVIDPVEISNITITSSLPGSDVSLTVQFSGEETTVTWEVDGGAPPAGYQLSDRKRTLLIPSAQIGDDGRRFSVGVKNPVSEDSREYVLQLIVIGSSNQLSAVSAVPAVSAVSAVPAVSAGAVAAIVLGIIVTIVVFLITLKYRCNKREVERNGTSSVGGQLELRPIVPPETAGGQPGRDTSVSVKMHDLETGNGGSGGEHFTPAENVINGFRSETSNTDPLIPKQDGSVGEDIQHQRSESKETSTNI